MDTKREATPRGRPARRTFRETAAITSLLALGAASALWLLGRDIASPVKLLRAERVEGVDVAVELDETFSTLAEDVRRSVVSIGITRESIEADPQPVEGDEEEDCEREPGRWEEESIGSGFIIDARGFILTNHHLVKDSADIHVKLHDERESRARLIQSDPSSDIALIKIEEEGLRPIRLGDSDDARVGQWVLAVGNPFGLTQTVSAGIVSALHRSDLRILPFESFIQTDASINPGNSGGPLVSLRGEAIGINTAMYSNSGGGNQGIGFAIPINLAKALVDRWIEGKSASFLGLVPARVDPDMARYYGLETPRGAFVSRVDPEGPAETAGIRPKDLILAFGKASVRDEGHLRVLIAGSSPGQPIEVELRRGKSSETVTVVPREKEIVAQGAESPGLASVARTKLLGITVAQLTPDMAEKFGIPRERKGVVVIDLQLGSPAGKKGLRTGDIIVEVNESPIATLDELRKALEQSAGVAMVGIARGAAEATYVFLPR
jgi:serine protease Do